MMYARTVRTMAFLSSLVMLGLTSVLAQTEGGRGELIMSKLPSQNSAAYKAIRKLAGNATGQVLPLTKSEMWSLPKANVDAVKKAAAAYGASVYQLGDDAWNEVFHPMPGAKGTAERRKAVKDRATSSGEAKRIFMTEKQKIMRERAKASKGTMSVAMMLAPPPGAVEYALTKDAGANAPAQIKLPIDEKSVLKIKRTHVATKPDVIIWRGTVDGTGGPATLMWWPDGKMTGTVQQERRIYSIRHMGGEMHAVVEMSEDRMPPEHPSMSSRSRTDDPNLRDEPLPNQGDAGMLRRPVTAGMRSAKARNEKSKERVASRSPAKAGAAQAQAAKPAEAVQKSAPSPSDVIIDVIVAFTKKAASNYTDVRRELIDLAIEDTNESFRNSHLGHVKLRLVHAYQTDYVEEGGYFDHVWRFADADDGYMEEIHDLRMKYRADVAVLIVDDPTGCGLATRVFADAADAFAVVHHACAAVTYSLAHEIGHLIGARHDLNSDAIMTPFPYGHGYVNDAKWRDIMSLRESCSGCPRLPIWSGPKVMVDGVPAGNAETSDTVR
jgi:hypothetical protein